MRVDADDFARPCSCGREHQIAVKEILIEAGAVEKLEEEMSEGMLREYISPLVICDTNTYAATEELMEDIYDRCQVLVLDAEGLQADCDNDRIPFSSFFRSMLAICSNASL